MVYANSAAQHYAKQNKVWTFGVKAGLDFAFASPKPITSGFPEMFTAIEGTASVSDTNGPLIGIEPTLLCDK